MSLMLYNHSCVKNFFLIEKFLSSLSRLSNFVSITHFKKQAKKNVHSYKHPKCALVLKETTYLKSP